MRPSWCGSCAKTSRMTRLWLVPALLLIACGSDQLRGVNLDGGPVPDAGQDAGIVDAGFDAGPTLDAGFDAGPVDAGFDAGPMDAGPVDAGPVDAGTCPPGLTLCDGVCTNTQSDALNCNGCDMKCPSMMACSGGMCGPCAPTAGYVTLASGQGQPYNLANDPSKCLLDGANGWHGGQGGREWQHPGDARDPGRLPHGRLL